MTPTQDRGVRGQGPDRQARLWPLVLLALSGLGAWLVLGGAALGLGSLRRLGPGAFPVLAGAALLIAAALACLRPWSMSADDSSTPREGEDAGLRGVWAAVAGLAGFASLAPVLGYVPAAFAAALLASAGDARWERRGKLLQAVVLAGLVAAMFGVGLELPAASFRNPFAGVSWMP